MQVNFLNKYACFLMLLLNNLHFVINVSISHGAKEIIEFVIVMRICC